ncbi:MAG: SURF1 family-domain-containing protein [Monoraphidium minutum]|nr:MAG: SURF1 family-domain-containing protein [Monoraphidium minutum]
MLVPSAVAASMCYWQLQRMKWKEGVVQEAQAAMREPPGDVFALDELPRFRRCSAAGTYDHGRAVFVGPRPISFELSRSELRDPGMRAMLSEPSAAKGGYLLIEPLKHEASNRTVLVNRGWVPPDWRARWGDGAAAAQPAGRVLVTGAAQGSEEPSGFVPRNEPDRGNFFWLDVPGIAEACGLHPATPLLQVLQEDGLKGEAPSTAGSPFPLPKHAAGVVKYKTMPLDHANYAFVWGTMSATMGYMAARLLRRGR